MNTDATDDSYGRFWMTTTQISSLVFSIKACSDASLILSSYTGDTTQGYEILIGWNQNLDTIIRELPENEIKESTPGVLNCHNLHNFWIYWDSGVVQVGKGSVVLSESLVRMTRATNHVLNALSFKTATGITGSWEIFTTEYGKQNKNYFCLSKNPNELEFYNRWVYKCDYCTEIEAIS